MVVSSIGVIENKSKVMPRKREDLAQPQGNKKSRQRFRRGEKMQDCAIKKGWRPERKESKDSSSNKKIRSSHELGKERQKEGQALRLKGDKRSGGKLPKTKDVGWKLIFHAVW